MTGKSGRGAGRWLLRSGEGGSVALSGGKAAGLDRLAGLGLRVPPYVVLTTDAYRDFCPDGVVPRELPGEVVLLLDEIWKDLAVGGHRLAVRSSAVEEDGSERSFAGQMESYLGVATRSGLAAAVLGCWRSLHGDRAVAYRGDESGGSAMAVVVQRLVIPEAAGVLFTVNPVSRRDDEILINALWGLGEGLVSGELDADTFVLNRSGEVKTRHLARKEFMKTVGDGSATKTVSVDPDRVDAPSIGDDELKALTLAALRVEETAGLPQDMEFAVAEGEVFFLQSRPVTAFTAGEKRIWDNSNIIESYPGITLPLTYSFISRAYQAVYWQFCQVLGMPEKAIGHHDDMLSNMLGHIRGRVYYNLLNWYRLVSLLPGFRFNKQFMEGMMGVSQTEELDQAPPTWREKFFREFPRLVVVGLRCIYLQLTLERRIAAFHRSFEAAHRTFSAIDYEKIEPVGVMAHYDAMEKEVLWKWKAPIINDFSAMIFYGLLARLTRTWGVDPEGGLHNILVSRQGGIESTEVATGLQRIAALVAGDAELAASLRQAPPGEALALLQGREDLVGEFQSYLEDFGDRTIAELKLESKSMREDPSFCLAMLQNYLRGTAAGADRQEDAARRRRAEAQVAARLRGRLTPFGLPRLIVYRRVLKNARAAIRNRENQRLARTRAFAVVRRMFRAMGGTWARRGFLGEERDVFYLTIEDLRRAAVDENALAGLAGLVRERKEEFAGYRAAAAPPEHFVTYGEIADDTPLVGDDGSAGDDGLTGLGACPGVVEGEALVLHEPDRTVQIDGEILVAPLTDPGWVLLFPSISGLVVERGSMLSHSAIVAREMGIPAVVGVKGATAAIATGDRIRIDGGRGTVVRL